MRKSKFTDSQILAIIKQDENGVPVHPPLDSPKACIKFVG